MFGRGGGCHALFSAWRTCVSSRRFDVAHVCAPGDVNTSKRPKDYPLSRGLKTNLVPRASERFVDRSTETDTLPIVLTLDHSPVHSDPKLMGGTLVFRGSRVPAQTLLDYLDDGYSFDEFLDMFPSVHRDDADEFLRLARGTSHEGHPGRESAQAA